MQKVKLKNDEDLLISISQPEDAESIIQYLSTIGGETDYLSFGEGEFQKTLAEEEAIILKYLNQENHLHIMGLINGEIVAILDVSASSKPRLRHSAEFGITVRKAHWGKGVASAMINYMIAWAKETKVLKKLNLQVVSTNENAINLYRKFDFTMEGRITKEFYVNGAYQDMIHMGYWLD